MLKITPVLFPQQLFPVETSLLVCSVAVSNSTDLDMHMDVHLKAEDGLPVISVYPVKVEPHHDHSIEGNADRSSQEAGFVSC